MPFEHRSLEKNWPNLLNSLSGEKGEQTMRSLIIGAVVIVALPSAVLAQDIEAGQTSFKKCQACHDVGETAKNKIGPVLNGLDGRKSGGVEGYSYSDANKNSGITWTEATFKEYINDPRAKIPDTKMVFPGIKNEKEAGDLWAYLKQFDQNGKKK
jgi:cytochrome c